MGQQKLREFSSIALVTKCAASLVPAIFELRVFFKPLSSKCYTLPLKWSRYRPGVAQRVGRGIALLFHDRGTRTGWLVSSTPRVHFTSGKDPGPILQEAGWALGPVWTGRKSRPHREFFFICTICYSVLRVYIITSVLPPAPIPDRPAHSQSLYLLSYPAHTHFLHTLINREKWSQIKCPNFTFLIIGINWIKCGSLQFMAPFLASLSEGRTFSIAGYKTFCSTCSFDRAGHRLNESIWCNQTPFSWWICTYVIFKNTQCDTTQSSCTDFIFKVWEDHERFHWRNREKNVIMLVLIILKLNKLCLWQIAWLKVNKKLSSVSFYWNLCLYTKKFGLFWLCTLTCRGQSQGIQSGSAFANANTGLETYTVRFEVLTAVMLKIHVLWDVCLVSWQVPR